MTLPTALAAPVDEGMMLAEAPRPPLQSSVTGRNQRDGVRSCTMYGNLRANPKRTGGRSIDSLLSGGGGVDGGHQTLDDFFSKTKTETMISIVDRDVCIF